MRRSQIILCALFVLALIGAALAAAPAQAAFPGANGKIAFSRYVENGTPDFRRVQDIFTANPDGTNQVNITDQPFDDVMGAWSPDGQTIAFTHTTQIHMMNADGNAKELFVLGAAEPTWLADRSRLAFVRFWTPPPASEDDPIPPPQRDIFAINSNRTGTVNLTNDPFFDDGPAWSPDGTKIAYASDHNSPNGNAFDIYTMNPDGTGQARLTFDGGSNGMPDWSPDSNKIVFAKQGDIWVMNADGSGQTRLTFKSTGSSNSSPAWSPDGKKILFDQLTVTGCCLDTWVMNADGSAQSLLMADAAYPDWQALPIASYEHPQSAQSIQTSLIPEFEPCGTQTNPTNGEHSPPLGIASCLPPTPGSNIARVGASSQGSASFTVVAGDTDPTNGDQADVSLSASISDVKTPAGADYTPNPTGPDLTEITRLRLTDKANNYGGASATATEYDFRVPLECSGTTDNSLGSSCSTATSGDALLPGFITEQRQTVIQAFRVRVDDAGANGTTGDADDRIFATQGIYIP